LGRGAGLGRGELKKYPSKSVKVCNLHVFKGLQTSKTFKGPVKNGKTGKTGKTAKFRGEDQQGGWGKTFVPRTKKLALLAFVRRC
jgi:hypothetical protein